jgi:hypothetical protein
MNTKVRDPFKRAQNDYSLTFKMQVVDEVEKGLLTRPRSRPAL